MTPPRREGARGAIAADGCFGAAAAAAAEDDDDAPPAVGPAAAPPLTMPLAAARSDPLPSPAPPLRSALLLLPPLTPLACCCCCCRAALPLPLSGAPPLPPPPPPTPDGGAIGCSGLARLAKPGPVKTATTRWPSGSALDDHRGGWERKRCAALARELDVSGRRVWSCACQTRACSPLPGSGRWVACL